MEFPQRFAIMMSSEAIGGLERYLVDLAVAMKRTSCEPTLLNLKSKTPYEADLRSAGVTLHASLAPSRFSASGPTALLRLLRTCAPDVLLIGVNRQAMLLGAPLGRLCQVPVTALYSHTHMGQHRFTLRVAARLVDAVVAAGDRHRSYLSGLVRHGHVVSICPGLNLQRTSAAGDIGDTPRGSESPSIAIVAALRPEKDHGTFLRAAAIVKEHLSQAQFLIIGDGAARSTLEGLARSLAIDRCTQFLGWRTVGGELLKQIDVLVLASISEVFPAVIIEAFGAGVPVVATDVGSVSELMGAEEACGLLVPPREPSQLAAAIIRVVQEPGLARAMSNNARVRAQLFTAERFCSDMLGLARQIRANKADRASGPENR